MDDPYVYRGTGVLKNKAGIRTEKGLQRFERLATAQRLAEGISTVALTVDGFRALHRHIFQDVYNWAGAFRTVDIAKGGHLFCRAVFVEREMEKRFEAMAAQGPWAGIGAQAFVARVAEHMAELNAIHPFREGNGRTMRAFLKSAGREAGQAVHIERIDPTRWLEASRDSFRTGNAAAMQRVIAEVVGSTSERGPEPQHGRSPGGGR